MGTTVTSRYDVAEHLRTPEDMAAYREACLEEAGGDATFIAQALGHIAHAKGMAQVALDAGLSRESLYKALAGERPATLARRGARQPPETRGSHLCRDIVATGPGRASLVGAACFRGGFPAHG